MKAKVITIVGATDQSIEDFINAQIDLINSVEGCSVNGFYTSNDSGTFRLYIDYITY